MIDQYYSAEAAEQLLKNPGTLAVISLDSPCTKPHIPGLIPIGLDSLCEYRSEVISCSGSIVRGHDGGCLWSASDEVMCIATWIPPEACGSLASSTEAAYLTLLETLQRNGYPHPFRFWNFIPEINNGTGDEEPYRQFCSGRLRAFERFHYADIQFPAASALGHHREGAVIYALASREPGTHYENPKQQQAYCYPRQYGPSSPSFSRATQVNPGAHVFISGTASILGHETQAINNFASQLSTTLKNIDCLRDHISANAGPLEAIRVYLRHRENYEECKQRLNKQFQGYDILYTEADICRANLLVEIEAAFKIKM